MQSLLILFFGCLEIGKSSFITNLIDEAMSNVKSFDISEALNVEFYAFNDSSILFPNHQQNSKLIIIPGLQDYQIRSEDKNIIKYNLIEFCNNTLHIILLFKSTITYSLLSKPQLEPILNAFWESIIKSVLGLVTKLDKLNDKQTEFKRAGLLSFNKFLIVESFYDTEEKKINSELKLSQIKNFKSIIQRRNPLRLSNIYGLKFDRDTLGYEISSKAKDKFEEKKKCFTLKVPVSEVDLYPIRYCSCFLTINEDVLVKKFRRKARIVPEEYIDYDYLPIEYFIDLAVKESKEVLKYREKIIDDSSEVIKCKLIKCEKNENLYYFEIFIKTIKIILKTFL